jgi:hypothetical protein
VDVQDVAAEWSPVDRFDEFGRLVDAAQAEHLGKGYPAEIKLFEFLAASDDDLVAAEEELGTVFPDAYKQVMKRYGGGMFGFVDLLPLRSPGRRGGDLVSENSGDWAVAGFVAVAPAGTGDMWGFVSRNGRCEDTVSFWDHEDGHVAPAADGFLDFLMVHGLRRPEPRP